MEEKHSYTQNETNYLKKFFWKVLSLPDHNNWGLIFWTLLYMFPSKYKSTILYMSKGGQDHAWEIYRDSWNKLVEAHEL